MTNFKLCVKNLSEREFYSQVRDLDKLGWKFFVDEEHQGPPPAAAQETNSVCCAVALLLKVTIRCLVLPLVVLGHFWFCLLDPNNTRMYSVLITRFAPLIP